MNSILRAHATFRLCADDLLTKVVGGQSQAVAAEFWEVAAGGQAYTLTCTVGAFVLAGQGAALLVGHKTVATPGTFTLAGADVMLKAGRKITATVGAFALTGSDAILKAGRRVVASVGEFAFTGQSADLLAGRKMVAESGAFSFVGADAELVYVGSPVVPLTYSEMKASRARPKRRVMSRKGPRR